MSNCSCGFPPAGIFVTPPEVGIMLHFRWQHINEKKRVSWDWDEWHTLNLVTATLCHLMPLFWGHCWNILNLTSMIPAACSIVPWSAPIQPLWTWLHSSWNKRLWTLTFAGGDLRGRISKDHVFRCFLKRFKFKNVDLLMWFSERGFTGFHKFHKFVQPEKSQTIPKSGDIIRWLHDCLPEVGWHHSFDAPEWYSSTTIWQMLCFPCSNVFPWVFGTIATVLLKRHYREPQHFMEGWKLIWQPHPSFVFSELLLFAVFECHYGVQWFLTAFTWWHGTWTRSMNFCNILWQAFSELSRV